MIARESEIKEREKEEVRAGVGDQGRSESLKEYNVLILMTMMMLKDNMEHI